MPSNAFFTFTDPHSYQTAIRAGQIEIFSTTRGDFRAELTRVGFYGWARILQRRTSSCPLAR
jgi:hypothetical protein